MGEILNMIAGTFMVAAFGPTATCRLGLPRVAWVSAEEHASHALRD